MAQSHAPRLMPRHETKDLIHEGIATKRHNVVNPLKLKFETKDLIHEGIATKVGRDYWMSESA